MRASWVSMAVILSSILLRFSTSFSKAASMTLEPKGAPSIMMSSEMIVGARGNIADKLSAISVVEVMISHLVD